MNASTNILRLALAGAKGRMGGEITRLIDAEKGLSQITATVGRADWNSLNPATIDVVIDFTLPDGLRAAVKWCETHRKPLVSGTTGLSAEDLALLQKASHTIPVLWAPNMSLGVAWLRGALEHLGGLADYDMQIEESHHRHKKDAPSGTAKWLQQAAEGAVGRELPPPLAIRGGGIFGVHRVHVMGEEETLVLEHTALNRAVFARGALRAAHWLRAKPAGNYQIMDVLHKQERE